MLSFIFPLFCHAQSTDTIHVYFDLAVSSLNSQTRSQLDSLAYYDILPTNKKYGIIGYADYLGTEESNITLSQKRADAVEKYLQGLGVRPELIETVTGKGEISREMTGAEGYPTDRRVDIVIGGFKEKPSTPRTISNDGNLWKVYFEEQTTKENSGIKLKPGQDAIIAHLCDYLKKNGKVNIMIAGHAIGKNETVLVSDSRAKYVAFRLNQCGIHQSRIRTVAFGLTQNIPNGSKEDDFRRAIITIDSGIKKPEPAAQPKIDISKVAKNETIRLDNIFFLPGSHMIREESAETLFNLYTTMKFNPTLKINIEGHICCLTNTTEDGYDYDEKEYGLSKNRARAVYEYLTDKGIEPDRMTYEGFGIQQPLKWPERSLADENMNRRVEIRIIDK